MVGIAFLPKGEIISQPPFVVPVEHTNSTSPMYLTPFFAGIRVLFLFSLYFLLQCFWSVDSTPFFFIHLNALTKIQVWLATQWRVNSFNVSSPSFAHQRDPFWMPTLDPARAARNGQPDMRWTKRTGEADHVLIWRWFCLIDIEIIEYSWQWNLLQPLNG